MHDGVLLILFIIFGWAAFFFGVIYLLGKFIAWIGRGMFGIFKPCVREDSCEPRRTSGSGSRGCVCPRELCRKVEDRLDARYCSQCGAPLTHPPESGPL